MDEYPPITPREELNALLNAAIEIGLKLIAKHGNHIPFAVTARMNGERLNIAADNTEVHDGAILGASLVRVGTERRGAFESDWSRGEQSRGRQGGTVPP